MRLSTINLFILKCLANIADVWIQRRNGDVIIASGINEGIKDDISCCARIGKL